MTGPQPGCLLRTPLTCGRSLLWGQTRGCSQVAESLLGGGSFSLPLGHEDDPRNAIRHCLITGSRLSTSSGLSKPGHTPESSKELVSNTHSQAIPQTH